MSYNISVVLFCLDLLATSTDLTPLSEKSSSNIVPILLGNFGGAGLIAILCLVFCQRSRHQEGYPRKGEYAYRSVFRLRCFCYKKHKLWSSTQMIISVQVKISGKCFLVTRFLEIRLGTLTEATCLAKEDSVKFSRYDIKRGPDWELYALMFAGQF